jgi:3-isopropylmalate/(R)-2-methylmalate dehydratase small subunit
VRGDDIDTDRIIPARYLRTVTFDGLGDHAFEDDRASADPPHPFDDPRFAGARILIANRNFGCGSSREHAPQALTRWGIAGFVGESFAEIFFGNCVALGLPCLTASAAGIDQLMSAAEEDPTRELTLDLAAQTVRFDDQSIEAIIPDGPRAQLLKGEWDALGQLLTGSDEIAARAERLPYIRGFR